MVRFHPGAHMDLKSTYNKIAEEWSKAHGEDDWWHEGMDKFISFLAPNSWVLDAGCAWGAKAKYLKKRGINAVGIDFSETMIEVARLKVPKIEFEVMDIYDLSKLKRSFDGIVAQNVLLHIPKKDIPVVLEQIKSKLCQHGYLYVTVKEVRIGQAEEMVVTNNDYGYPFERFFSFFKLEEMINFFKTAGFEIVFQKVIHDGDTNWIQLIGKR